MSGSENSRPRIPDGIAAVIADANAYGDGRIHDAFSWLRANQPLGIASPEGFDPFWVVSRHEDIRAFAQKSELFLSGQASITLVDRAEQQRIREALEGHPEPVRMIINMDPPDHPVYRAIAAEAFRAHSLERMNDTIERVARRFVDDMEATGGACDFARTVAFVYPLRVIMSILGIPPEDEPYLLKLTQQFVGNHDAEQSRSGVALSGAEAADQYIAVAQDFKSYFADVMADRRARPRDDVATLLAQATIDGTPLPELEALSYYIVLATAGHDTTAAATAGGMIELARHPDEFAKVKADPRLVNTFVEEAIRWVSPSKLTMRMASADVEMCGRQLRRGDLVGLAWASANRDESVFRDPFVFRADRRPNKLLAFGNGPHVCLGQHLARIEMRLLFQELFRRLENVELTGPTRSVSSFQISGPKTAPIRFSMCPARA